MTDVAIDFDAHYAVSGYDGVAFRVLSWVTETVYDGDLLVCDVEECDHSSGMCWVEGDYSEVTSDTQVIAVMVGDDYKQTVDVDDLVKIDEDDYCHGCGQIGCVADGRE